MVRRLERDRETGRGRGEGGRASGWNIQWRGCGAEMSQGAGFADADPEPCFLTQRRLKQPAPFSLASLLSPPAPLMTSGDITTHAKKKKQKNREKHEAESEKNINPTCKINKCESVRRHCRVTTRFRLCLLPGNQRRSGKKTPKN